MPTKLAKPGHSILKQVNKNTNLQVFPKKAKFVETKDSDLKIPDVLPVLGSKKSSNNKVKFSVKFDESESEQQYPMPSRNNSSGLKERKSTFQFAKKDKQHTKKFAKKKKTLKPMKSGEDIELVNQEDGSFNSSHLDQKSSNYDSDSSKEEEDSIRKLNIMNQLKIQTNELGLLESNNVEVEDFDNITELIQSYFAP